MIDTMGLRRRLFAAEAAGGAEAAGERAADAGQSAQSETLRPEPAETGSETGETPTAPQGAAEQGDAGPASWEEARERYRAEFDAELRRILQARLKKERARAEELEPLLALLSERYGLDPQKADAAALTQKLRAEAEAKQKAAAVSRRGEARAHYRSLRAQAAALSEKVPGFALSRELENDAFAALTRPGSPVSLEQAYYALHPEFRRAEAEAVARRAAEAVAASVRAGQARPRENGASGAAVAPLSYRNMSRADREALRARIRAAAARGEHLPYGG